MSDKTDMGGQFIDDSGFATCGGCCRCKVPQHVEYGETCAKCGKHRPPGAPIRWQSDERAKREGGE